MYRPKVGEKVKFTMEGLRIIFGNNVDGLLRKVLDETFTIIKVLDQVPISDIPGGYEYLVELNDPIFNSYIVMYSTLIKV